MRIKKKFVATYILCCSFPEQFYWNKNIDIVYMMNTIENPYNKSSIVKEKLTETLQFSWYAFDVSQIRVKRGRFSERKKRGHTSHLIQK